MEIKWSWCILKTCVSRILVPLAVDSACESNGLTYICAHNAPPPDQKGNEHTFPNPIGLNEARIVYSGAYGKK